jgi:hypothetical protein
VPEQVVVSMTEIAGAAIPPGTLDAVSELSPDR